jgi:hypothetical protein
MMTYVIASWLAWIGAPEKATYKPKTVIEFSEVQVNGQIVRPEMTRVQGRGRSQFRPLVRARADFRPELQRSLDNI